MFSISIDRKLIEAKDIFPLPLAPMEYFWLWDDVPSHPMHFRLIIELAGKVDVPLLERSIAISVARHPMLLAVIDSTTHPRQWLLPHTPSFGWRWNAGTWRESPFPIEWDLSVEGGLRIWGNQLGESAELCVEAHHASSDGLGLRQFMRDVFVTYDQLTRRPNDPSILPKLSIERLRERGKFSRPAPTDEGRSTTLGEKLLGAYHFHFRGPSPIASPWSQSNPKNLNLETRSHPQHHYFRTSFDESETASITASHASLNDLAVTRMFQVLATWNIEHGSARMRQRLRILIPTDLRTFRDSRSPACNRLGFGFAVTTIAESHDFEQLLTSIQSQTQAIRKYRLGLDFVEIFGLLSRYPRLGAWLIHRPRCLATAVLTNLGDAMGRYRKSFDVHDSRMQVGDLSVKSFAGFPPLRPQTHFGVGLSRYEGRLTLASVIDAERFSYELAEQLHEAWIRAWRSSSSTPQR